MTLLCHGSEKNPNYVKEEGTVSTVDVNCAKGVFDFDVVAASCTRRLEPGKWSPL